MVKLQPSDLHQSATLMPSIHVKKKRRLILSVRSSSNALDHVMRQGSLYVPFNLDCYNSLDEWPRLLDTYKMNHHRITSRKALLE